MDVRYAKKFDLDDFVVYVFGVNPVIQSNSRSLIKITPLLTRACCPILRSAFLKNLGLRGFLRSQGTYFWSASQRVSGAPFW